MEYVLIISLMGCFEIRAIFKGVLEQFSFVFCHTLHGHLFFAPKMTRGTLIPAVRRSDVRLN